VPSGDRKEESSKLRCREGKHGTSKDIEDKNRDHPHCYLQPSNGKDMAGGEFKSNAEEIKREGSVRVPVFGERRIRLFHELQCPDTIVSFI
jgi:hypothetical protein